MVNDLNTFKLCIFENKYSLLKVKILFFAHEGINKQICKCFEMIINNQCGLPLEERRSNLEESGSGSSCSTLPARRDSPNLGKY